MLSGYGPIDGAMSTRCQTTVQRGRRLDRIVSMADSSIFWLRVAALLYAIGLLHSMLAILRRPG